MRRHAPAAVRTATLLGAGPDAEDVVQEAFVKSYAAMGRFREGHAFRPWLLRIVANETRNLHRSAGRRRAREQHAWGRVKRCWPATTRRPHEVVALDADGTQRRESARLAGHTLIWEGIDATLRPARRHVSRLAGRGHDTGHRGTGGAAQRVGPTDRAAVEAATGPADAFSPALAGLLGLVVGAGVAGLAAGDDPAGQRAGDDVLVAGPAGGALTRR